MCSLFIIRRYTNRYFTLLSLSWSFSVLTLLCTVSFVNLLRVSWADILCSLICGLCIVIWSNVGYFVFCLYACFLMCTVSIWCKEKDGDVKVSVLTYAKLSLHEPTNTKLHTLVHFSCTCISLLNRSRHKSSNLVWVFVSIACILCIRDHYLNFTIKLERVLYLIYSVSKNGVILGLKSLRSHMSKRPVTSNWQSAQQTSTPSKLELNRTEHSEHKNRTQNEPKFVILPKNPNRTGHQSEEFFPTSTLVSLLSQTPICSSSGGTMGDIGLCR